MRVCPESHIFNRMRRLPALLALVLLMAGRQSYPKAAFTPIRHVVVLDLKDAGEYREFGADCFQLLFIPGVVNVVTGPGLETCQPDTMPCSTAVVLDLDTADSCRKLPEQPAYIALMQKWKPRASSVHVVSFGPRCDEPRPSASTAANPAGATAPP